jgi:hypothetical protein
MDTNSKYVCKRPWRKSPFIRDCYYRVRRDFKSEQYSFFAGELLCYEGYEGPVKMFNSTGFFFFAVDEERFRVWTISEDEDLETWRELFEKLETDYPCEF